MDLLLWRHAEAHELTPEGHDLARALTPRGEKQAKRMAQWLDRQLPDNTRILVSPAVRTEQTASALGRRFKCAEALLPSAHGSQALLNLVQWPTGRGTVLVVGHQPALGQTLARLLGTQEADFPVKKGGLWWLRARQRDGVWQTVVLSVQTPELL